MAIEVGVISAAFVYHGKSMLGVSQQHVWVGYPGVYGDRQLVVVGKKEGEVVTAKTMEGVPLLSCTAWREDGHSLVEIEGKCFPADDPRAAKRLSEIFSKPVEIVPVSQLDRPRRTNFNFSLRPGVGYDSSPIHVLTTDSLHRMRRLVSTAKSWNRAR